MGMPRPAGLLLSLVGLLALARIPPADGGCVEPREVEECPMLDYKIYPNQDVDEAEEKIAQVVVEQITVWKGKVGMKEGRDKKKSKGIKLDFCEDLIRCVLDRSSSWGPVAHVGMAKKTSVCLRTGGMLLRILSSHLKQKH